MRGAAPLTSRTGLRGIDTRFADRSRSVSPGKPFLTGRLPGLHLVVERSHRNRQVVEVFISAAESPLTGTASPVPAGLGRELSHKTPEPQPSCRACGTYRHGRNS